MKYSYGYLKEAVLAKMDMTSEEANELGLLNKIPFYANEGLAQITAGIKSNHKYMIFNVRSSIEHKRYLKDKFKLDRTDFLNDDMIPDSSLSPAYLTARKEYNAYAHTNIASNMPEDFIRWSQDKVLWSKFDDGELHEVGTESYTTYGDTQIIFFNTGVYHIPYDAYWCQFNPSMLDITEIDMPQDIMECLPAYIASQLFKIDDEQKASILRNEWEIAIARIDDNASTSRPTIHNRSDW